MVIVCWPFSDAYRTGRQLHSEWNSLHDKSRRAAGDRVRRWSSTSCRTSALVGRYAPPIHTVMGHWTVCAPHPHRHGSLVGMRSHPHRHGSLDGMRPHPHGHGSPAPPWRVAIDRRTPRAVIITYCLIIYSWTSSPADSSETQPF